MNNHATGPLRVLVMGAGAMGSAVGGFLAEAGHRVTLVGRDPHIAAVRRNGLRISGIWGDHHVSTLEARTEVEGIERGAFDVVLMCVKSYDTAGAIRAVAPLVGADTLVCAYQNGLGNAERIAEVVGWERTIGARAIFGVWLEEPGWADITVIANPTAVGAYDPRTPAARVRDLAAAMDASGLPTVFTDQIATVLWGKVAYNCALNPLSALLDVPYGALLETEHTRQIMGEVVHELYAVAAAMGVHLKPDSADGYVGHLFEDLIPPTGAHYASMREDFRLRRRTEIDALNGAICGYGVGHGVPCPTNTVLTRLVRAREHAIGAR